jgi:hypothetical protein
MDTPESLVSEKWDLTTSGLGKGSAVPAEIKGWNWGAFGFNWVWGIGNGTYIALLCFIPFVNIVMPFILGAKGNKWAWQNRRWESIAHFKKIQRIWTIVFFAVFVGTIVIYGSLFAFMIVTHTFPVNAGMTNEQ